MSRFPEADLRKVKTIPHGERPRHVSREEFARPVAADATLSEFLDALPRFLKAQELAVLVEAICEARRKGAPFVIAMGAHLLKVGLAPLLIDLMEKGFLTALALNGAGVIHDVEIALFGRTSEDVASSLDDGTFGFSAETAEAVNGAVLQGHRKNLGYGEAMGFFLDRLKNCPYRHLSLLHAAHRLGLPVTVHVALGTDIVHQHPSADGQAIGATSMRDFRILCEVLRHLSGGVWLNLGSAVVLPEVFLKALSVARNLYGPIQDFTTANLDMLQHYRPSQNVVRRPTRLGSSRGISITGHHEILVPLLCAAMKSQWAKEEAEKASS